MPTYEIDEAREQAIKAAKYFARVLTREGSMETYLAANVGGVTIVVAIRDSGEKLEDALVNGRLLGEGTRINKPAGQKNVILIPRMHAPPPEFANRPGNIHLHVLSGVQLDRRERKSGEALCSKKHGSNERAPEPGETAMCPECVKVAEEFNLDWSLE